MYNNCSILQEVGKNSFDVILSNVLDTKGRVWDGVSPSHGGNFKKIGYLIQIFGAL